MSDKPDITSTWRKLFSFKSEAQENSTVKSVLIVDDEKPLLLSISDGLKAYAEEFHVLTALNGKEAINILNSNKIDLMVTDLKMPKMNGFELLAWMSKNHSDIPVIVMTAFGTLEIEDKLRNMGTFRYLEKPLDINILVTNISAALNDDSANGYSRGISLASFLHLIEMEKMTCTIKVKSDREAGYLSFDNGEIMDSAVGKLKGKAAVLDILNWNNAEIDINFTCEVKENNINSSIRELLAEASEFEEAKQKAKEETKAITEEAKAIEKGEEKGKLGEEEEAWLKAADETIMATEEEDAKLKAEKDSWLKAEKEARLKAEEEARLKAEEEAKLRAEEEARLKAEKEAKLKAEEEARLKAEEEARLRAEEEDRLKAEEEDRLKAEEDARLKAEKEAKLRAEEDARLRAEEEDRLKNEEDAKLKAEKEARLKAEEDARLKAEKEARLKAEEDARLKAEEEARLKAEKEAKLKAEEEAREITRQKIKAWKKA